MTSTFSPAGVMYVKTDEKHSPVYCNPSHNVSFIHTLSIEDCLKKMNRDRPWPRKSSKAKNVIGRTANTKEIVFSVLRKADYMLNTCYLH